MTNAMRKVIQAIADRTIKDGGVTYSIAKSEFVMDIDCWFYPKFSALTRVVPVDDLTQALSDYVDRHAELLEQENIYLGAWINPESKRCHIDVNTYSITKEEALEEARRINEEQGGQILAIYNPHLKKSIALSE